MSDYESKYLKYKTKYKGLTQSGGSNPYSWSSVTRKKDKWHETPCGSVYKFYKWVAPAVTSSIEIVDNVSVKPELMYFLFTNDYTAPDNHVDNKKIFIESQKDIKNITRVPDIYKKEIIPYNNNANRESIYTMSKTNINLTLPYGNGLDKIPVKSSFFWSYSEKKWFYKKNMTIDNPKFYTTNTNTNPNPNPEEFNFSGKFYCAEPQINIFRP